MELPEVAHSSDFYFWFNLETKKEYYSTPIYFYKTDFSIDTKNNLLEIYYKENSNTGLRFTPNLYFPFSEKFGLLLLRFLNADLSNYEKAYKTFFYAYGFEVLKELNDKYKFDLNLTYNNDTDYLEATHTIFENLKENLVDLQKELINSIDYIYNLNNVKSLEKYTYSERYAVYLIKQKGKLYSYYKNDLIIRDSYSKKYDEFKHISDSELLELLKTKNMLLSMNITHKSNDLSSICYAILDKLSQTPNYPIKKCQNCGMYFIPTSKVDEIYCDYPKENGKTCRDLGAFQSYTERLKNNKAMGEYRRTYQQKFMQIRKDQSNEKLKSDFETWKKQAKEQINNMKKGKLTEDEVYQWILKNK